MGSAYVPGLKVTASTVLRLERRLPLKGEVVVNAGDAVRWDQVVAHTHLPGSVEMINVAARLGLEPAEVPECMLKTRGQQVTKGEGLARNKGFFGLFKATLQAPLSGTLESVSGVSGQVVLRGPAVPVQVHAYVDGVIERVIPEEGVVVRTHGAHLQGIFGIGGETAGEVVLATGDPGREMQVSDLEQTHAGKVVVGGALVTRQVLDRAVEIGVRALVVGGIHDQDLRDFLGYDLGVAITGSEDKGLTLVLTEGFGPIPMARRTFELLAANAGRRASVSGATQIRAGVIRPEILIPHLDEPEPRAAEGPQAGEGFVPGAWVRVIREPHFGHLARVLALPVEPVEIPTGARARVAEIELVDGPRWIVPRANLELIEE